VGLLLLVLFIGLPIAEIYVIIKVGEAIGVLPTIALLLLDGFLGVALWRSQGRVVWRRFNQALGEGRVPTREIFDGAMVLLGGAFLLAPGFITDVIGLLLLIPPTRAVFRGIVSRMARRRTAFTVRTVGWGRGTPYDGAGPRPGETHYDYEGSAREVDDGERGLPGRTGDGER
jgi:UPF0716 protein FxsA